MRALLPQRTDNSALSLQRTGASGLPLNLRRRLRLAVKLFKPDNSYQETIEEPSGDIITYTYNGDGLRVHEDDGVQANRHSDLRRRLVTGGSEFPRWYNSTGTGNELGLTATDVVE
ncbi:MAG: hypothetical protein JNL58_05625 [Planctomyces sp.]|nr:hypothetical protein [Planctomyces sp.]